MDFRFTIAIFLGIAFLFVVVVSSQRRKNNALTEEMSKLKTRINALSQYESIENAEKRASEILQSANDERDHLFQEMERAIHLRETEIERMSRLAEAENKKLRQEVTAQLEEAKNKAGALIAEAKERASEILQSANDEKNQTEERSRKLRQDAYAILENARRQAQSVVEKANTEAEKVAGDAYDAMKNLQNYQRELTAIRNVIEGYGNEYIVPSRNLLDDLAEEYGYTAAAQNLKDLRLQNSEAVKKGMAAICDYVENHRRNTAIDFVIDAFNGKVDSILSRAKTDNYGKLQQEIVDAFVLVNRNGQAFRNARITEEYRDARLEELRLAVVLQEMKDREREEQRRIREQIREEEKARREIERALREAQREEEMLQKAMEKIRGKFEEANVEQREMYEKQLVELEERLKEAEERNQRALSMAQQTKSGHVYVISNIGSFGEDIYKIGMTRRLEPYDRIQELGDASVPFAFDVHAMIWSGDAPALESNLHKTFALSQVNKVNYRKEFFKTSLHEIRSEIEKAGIEAKWTITAEAREYKESQAIEKAIAENPEMRKAWLNRQWEFENHAQVESVIRAENEEARAQPAEVRSR